MKHILSFFTLLLLFFSCNNASEIISASDNERADTYHYAIRLIEPDSSVEHSMLYFIPDSTIDYSLRLVDPAKSQNNSMVKK